MEIIPLLTTAYTAVLILLCYDLFCLEFKFKPFRLEACQTREVM